MAPSPVCGAGLRPEQPCNSHANKEASASTSKSPNRLTGTVRLPRAGDTAVPKSVLEKRPLRQKGGVTHQGKGAAGQRALGPQSQAPPQSSTLHKATSTPASSLGLTGPLLRDTSHIPVVEGLSCPSLQRSRRFCPVFNLRVPTTPRDVPTRKPFALTGPET